MMLFIARFTSLIFVASAVGPPGLERPRIPTPAVVVEEAETFALKRHVEPNELVVLLVGAVPHGRIDLESSLLVLTPTNVKLMSEGEAESILLFPEVLATNLKVVAISREFPGDSAFFHIFRHNLLLHIIIGERPRLKAPVKISTLLWFDDGTRKFVCVDRCDNLVHWVEPTAMDRCSPTGKRWAPKSIFFWRISTAFIPTASVHLDLTFNGSRIPARFQLTAVVTKNFQKSKLYRFSTTTLGKMRCVSLIRWRDLRVSAFVRPFDVDIWISTFINLLIVAKLISWLKKTSLTQTAVTILMSLIAVIDIDDRGRKYSQIIASGTALTLSFFVAQLYLNFLMLFFLNPHEVNDLSRND